MFYSATKVGQFKKGKDETKQGTGQKGGLAHCDTGDGDDDAENGLVGYGAAGDEPAEGDDGTGL